MIIFCQVSNANVGKETGLEIPRYVSLKSDDANIRVGPSKNYPIEIKYIKKNYPLKVLEEYEEWRKVEDFNKNIGWIHKSLISGIRTGIVLSNYNKNIKLLNTLDGNVIGEIGYGNIVFLEKCKIDWCLVSLGDFEGWIDNFHDYPKNLLIFQVISGGVRERPNRHAWKACVGKPTVGSNPTSSA